MTPHQCILNVKKKKNLIISDKYVSLIHFIITIGGIKPKQPAVVLVTI